MSRIIGGIPVRQVHRFTESIRRRARVGRRGGGRGRMIESGEVPHTSTLLHDRPSIRKSHPKKLHSAAASASAAASGGATPRRARP